MMAGTSEAESKWLAGRSSFLYVCSLIIHENEGEETADTAQSVAICNDGGGILRKRVYGTVKI